VSLRTSPKSKYIKQMVNKLYIARHNYFNYLFILYSLQKLPHYSALQIHLHLFIYFVISYLFTNVEDAGRHRPKKCINDVKYFILP